MTTRKDIEAWVNRGITSGQKWLIVTCDTFSYEDYPVYARTDGEFDEKYAFHNGQNMQKIMEIYDLSGNIAKQLDEHRAWSYPATSKYNPNRIESNPLLLWVENK